ncbi:MAG: signal peptidase I [Pseudobutyrivibrio sp.]|nr:signal peptidase I [Pseudobutyrivibrio sp.]
MFINIKRFFSRKFGKNKSSLNFRRRRRQINKLKIGKIFLFLLETSIMILLAYATVDAFGRQIEVSNASMEPTYGSKQMVLVNIYAYSFFEPEVGDVIVFKPKANVNANYSVKRIIAGPGDTVLIKKGRLYINGERLTTGAGKEYINDSGMAASELTLPEGEFFVIGDNPNFSEDSRYDTIGNVTLGDIYGKVWAKYLF